MRCGNCNSEVPAGSNFCGNCGTRLIAAGTASPLLPPSAGETSVDDGERRHLTVMFCDLVDSTTLAKHLDPEDVHLLLRQYQETCEAAVSRNKGHIAQYLGDGLLVYFGYPDAHEDDAARAVASALEIVDAIENLEPRKPLPDGLSLAIRVGIHAGEVVTANLGRNGHRERLALGDVPNTAARLQTEAGRNEVIVSEQIFALTRDEIEYADAGSRQIKGLGSPLRTFRPLRRVAAAAMYEARSGQTLFGRDQELARLLDGFGSLAGGARAMRIVGQPGIGKTSLALALKHRLAGQRHEWLVCRCASDEASSMLYPLVELLASWARLRPEESSSAQADRLRAKLAQLCGPDDGQRLVPGLQQLLGVPGTAAAPGSIRRPEDQKELLFEAVLGWMQGHLRRHPLVLVVEDFHWADPSTAELLGRLLRAVEAQPLLLVVTQRPEGASPEWIHQKNVETLLLGTLSEESALAMIRHRAPDAAEARVRGILARADGVPLFIEELGRQSAAESLREDDFAPATQIPERVRDLFTARLDRLGPAKQLAGLAAVIGREFAVELLRRLVDLPESAFQAQIAALVDGGIVTRDVAGETCRFSHALVRDSALANLLRSRLREHHLALAQCLERHYPEEVEQRPERLGRHWGDGGNPDRALPYFARAAERARSVYANAECVALVRRALNVVDMSAAPEPAGARGALVLDLRELLSDMLILLRRNEEALQCLNGLLDDVDDSDRLRRARLKRKLGAAGREVAPYGIPALLDGLRDLEHDEPPDRPDWRKEWLRIKLELSITYYQLGSVDEMLALAGEIEPFIDDYGTADQQAELANHLLLLDRRTHRFAATANAMRYGRAFLAAAERAGDLAQQSAAASAWAFLLMDHGDFAEADAAFARALSLCRESGNQSAEVRTLTYYSILQRRSGNVDEAAALSRQCSALAEAAAMRLYVATASGNLGWAAWRLHRRVEARRLLESSLAGWQQVGVQYPFRWITQLPLLAMDVEDGDPAAGRKRLVEISSDDQQLLHAEVAETIVRALTGEADLADVLESARRHGYL